ncbi:MAG: response regulator transcription factor [Parabacteroides sp.]|jgi:two-component system, LytTR family, response regulator|nr:response regulator transcription factor [Parabacteroides sp.]MBP9481327.1 response regulator transcription factor [Parabacteroides sp.]MDD2416455.1 LytTR family DNA-binding domain-containing protein [Parabacteroides sp.]MDD4406035.1 LytTR family DNA-binding domain-containing protein [Parabacteroides sp.]
MVKVVIIDDEKSSRETIKFLLADYFPEVTVSAEAESVDDAVKIIEEQNPELVFLDIEIKGGTGLHVLQRLKKRDFKLIFITAFNDFAIKAIKFSAIDYILKPINEFEFKNGVERAILEIGKISNSSQTDTLFANQESTKERKLVLRTSQEIHIVNISEIVHCVSDNAYTTFRLNTGEKIVVSKGIGEYADLLAGFGFLRPHQSHLVNINYIKKLDKSDGGFLILKDKTQIPVSSRQKQQLIDLLSKL